MFSVYTKMKMKKANLFLIKYPLLFVSYEQSAKWKVLNKKLCIISKRVINNFAQNIHLKNRKSLFIVDN